MKNQVKSYKFRFSTLIHVVFCVALVLSAIGIALTVWRIVEQGGSTPYEWLSYAILLLVSVLMALIVISMIVKSEYVLTKEQLILTFGIIKTKYDLKKIYSVHLFRGAGKLTVYFDDYKTNYVIINVKEEWYDDFVKNLLELNPKIGFSFSSPEEEEDIKKDK